MNRKEKGFTLIELLAVIVILAIIMVIASMQVNKQIKKSKKNANEINKQTIVKAVKACMVENESEECDTISKLQEKGYLDSFADPWDKNNTNLDDLYTIVISEDDARVIYHGNGITEENETPPEEYFSWCNNDKGKHTCTDGLTSEGKVWLQKHDDILIFPGNINTIKDCESTTKDCTNFSGVNIDALIVTSNVSISANFSGTSDNYTNINVIRIDGGSIGGSKFKYTNIKNLVIGNADKISLGQNTFSGSIINNFKIENGSFYWYSFTGGTIDTLTIGEGVTNLAADTFEGTKISTIILNANGLNGNKDQPFRNDSTPTKLVIGKNVTKLGKNVIANNATSYGNYVRWVNVTEVEIKGDKTRFSKRDLFEFGLRWDQIPDDIGDSNNPDSYNLYIYPSSDFEASYKKPYNLAKEFAKDHDWLIIVE